MTAKAEGGGAGSGAGARAAVPGSPSGVGSHICTMAGCSFRAARRYNLSVHMRLHTGE